MPDDAAKLALRCMEQSKACWGEVARYQMDIDLPTVTLCKGHLWALMAPPGAPRHVKAQVAEELEGLSDD
jgi:hypothetical protein